MCQRLPIHHVTYTKIAPWIQVVIRDHSVYSRRFVSKKLCAEESIHHSHQHRMPALRAVTSKNREHNQREKRGHHRHKGDAPSNTSREEPPLKHFFCTSTPRLTYEGTQVERSLRAHTTHRFPLLRCKENFRRNA